MKQIIENIKANKELRANLIALKNQLKEAVKLQVDSGNPSQETADVIAFFKLIDWDMEFFRDLLNHEDAKVRKNVIQLIGICELDGLADDLFAAYESEQTLFVRPEYIKVLAGFDVTQLKDYLPKLTKIQKQLEQSDAGEKEKHVTAELRELNGLLRKCNQVKAHRFVGSDVMSTMILTTLQGKEIYLRKRIDETIGEGKTTLVRGGVKVESSDYENLMKVRCFQELLFVVPKQQRLVGDPKEIADQAMGNGLLAYLEERLMGSAAYRFRVAVTGMKDLDQRQQFVKKLSLELERASKHQLVSAPSDYEIELRFMKSKKVEGQFSLYLKLSVLKDERFAYRTNVVPTSIPPYVAALIMEMIAEDTKGAGQILDPFCGVGTLLIERSLSQYAHSMYGVDIYGQAVLWGEAHANTLHMPIHFLHKDMKDFTHDYPFELIITNPPYESKGMDRKEILDLYVAFLKNCTKWLATDGKVVVYTKCPDLFEQAMEQSDLRIEKDYDMYSKGKTRLYLLTLL